METILENKAENNSKFSTYLALGSCFFGTVLFVAFMYKPGITLLYMGFYYVLCAVIVNGLVFLSLGVELLLSWENRENILIKMLIMLANIPIVFLYLYLLFNSNNHF
jgi:hypothetical protein